PRSLDRGAFEGLLARPEFTCLSAHDQIATATAFTSKAIAHAVSALPKRPRSIIVAGGGIHNNVLMAMLRDRLGDIKIETADAIGAPPDMVEAELIGFLAARYIYRLPASFPRTTGAESPQICGRIIYPE
ncbi:MAG: anhydro-N-acetylmuramic acid kinase, partial [Candidatus Puniceispirillaceae bacterium]